MTEQQFDEITKKVEKEFEDYFQEELDKDKKSIFYDCRNILGIISIYNYITCAGEDYNYYKFPKDNILKTYLRYMENHEFEMTDDNIAQALEDYNANLNVEYLIRGKLYTPIPYGEEDYIKENLLDDNEYSSTCGDCGCHLGEIHLSSCDIELCPCCGDQMLSCNCGIKYPIREEQKQFLPKYIKQQEKDNEAFDKEVKDFLEKYANKQKNGNEM